MKKCILEKCASEPYSEWSQEIFSFAEKALGALVDNKLIVRQQWVFLAISILGCIRASIPKRLRNGWFFLLQWVQLRTTKMTENMKCFSYEERLRQSGLFNFENRRPDGKEKTRQRQILLGNAQWQNDRRKDNGHKCYPWKGHTDICNHKVKSLKAMN